MLNTSNPYQIGVAGSPVLQQGSVVDQERNYKEDEENSKAPLILPEPLDKINPILSTVFVSLLQVRGLISQAAENPACNVHKLDEVKEKIDEINKEILDLPNYLYRITL